MKVQVLKQGQRNMAKGDIASLIYLSSYSPGGSTRREFGRSGAFGIPILGKRS